MTKINAIKIKDEELIDHNFYYKLDQYKNLVPCSLTEWTQSFNKSSRIVKQDYIGTFFVSTVFLGMDHSFGGAKPLYFESMVFSNTGLADEFPAERYETWEEAYKGHILVVEQVAKYNGEHLPEIK